jgi:hypothetical protein
MSEAPDSINSTRMIRRNPISLTFRNATMPRAEPANTRRRYVTRIEAQRPEMCCDRRGRADYFRGFEDSFRFSEIPASGDEPGPGRPSSDGDGAAPVSRRGAASDEAPPGDARRNPCVRCAASACRQRREYALQMPACWIVCRAGKMSASASKRCEIVHSCFVRRDKWT